MRTIFARRDRGGLRCIARFGADRSGNIAIVWALMGLVLMLAIGAAIDVGRWLHARDQTVSAVDSAVLAGGRWLQTNSGDSGGAVATAQKFYSQNVATRLPVTGDTIAFAVGDDGMSITATGTAYIQNSISADSQHRQAAADHSLAGELLAVPACARRPRQRQPGRQRRKQQW